MTDPAALPPYQLGFPGTELRRRLVHLVLRGEKTATASLRQMYEPHTDEAVPQVGERFTLVGYADEPLGIVEVTRVEVRPLEDVELQFALDEGEGFTSLDEWRAGSLRYWAEYDVTDATLVVCEWFRLLSLSAPHPDRV